MADSPNAPSPDQPTAGQVAELYLGNLLFALERCAMALDGEDKAMEAAFYRGIARKLAEAHGRHRAASQGAPGTASAPTA